MAESGHSLLNPDASSNGLADIQDIYSVSDPPFLLPLNYQFATQALERMAKEGVDIDYGHIDSELNPLTCISYKQ